MAKMATQRQALTPFQELVVVIASLLIKRRVASEELSMNHIFQLTMTNPRAMALMDQIGWRESSWALADQRTLADAVQVNMRMRERMFFYDKASKTVIIEPKQKGDVVVDPVVAELQKPPDEELDRNSKEK